MRNFYTLLVLLGSLFMSVSSYGQIEQLSLRPLSTYDDAEQRVSSGAVIITSSDLELGGFDGLTEQIVGIRFPNVQLPIGATITNAYIQFTADEADSRDVNITIKAQRGGALTYSSASGNISSRPYTNSSVLWTPAAWPTIGERGLAQRTSDLSGLVREAIQSNFNSGDALAFTFTSAVSQGKRTAETSASGAAAAPELVIEYSEEPIERKSLENLLVINEVTGSGTIANNNDWVELYHKGTEAINLDSVMLTDDFDEPNKLILTQRNINGNSFVLVETDDFFGIKAEGETVYLFQTFNGELIFLDSLQGQSTVDKISYGRRPDGASDVVTFNQSTPGSSNNAAQLFLDLQFSRERGLHSSAFNLTLTAPQGATIRYTTNATIPSQSAGTIYTGPISISRNTVVKAIAYSNTGVSKTKTHTYIISNDDRLKEIPIVVVSTTNSLGSKTERGCTFEFINKDGEQSSQFADAGFQVFGNASVGQRKKNFRFKFRTEYGYSKFEHPVFKKRNGENYEPATRFNAFDLKSGQDATYSYSLGGTNMSENLLHNYMREMGNVDVHTQHVHVFMNDQYHGVYTLREHFTEHYAANYYGGPEEEYDYFKTGELNTTWSDNPSVKSGSSASWNELKSFATTDFQEIKKRLDVKHFIDYMMMHFVGCFEWEYRAFTDRDFDRSKFIFYHNDTDGFLRENPSGIGSYLGKMNTTSGEGPGKLFYLAGMGGFNLEYNTIAKDRITELLDENSPEGVLTVRNFTEKTNAFRAEYRRYQGLEHSRWGYTNNPEYERRVNGYLNYLPTRFQTVRNFLNSRRLIHTHSAVALSQPEGNILASQSVTISNPNAGTTVYYTLDGRDVVFDNGIAPWALSYTAGQALPLVAGENIVKARAYSNNNFGPLTEARYNVVSGINITAVGYNIEGDDDLEFLFVSNFNTEAISVGGDSIAAAIKFAFPAGTSIAAGETVMISRDLSKYPDVTLRKFAWSDGKLSNGGEQVIYKTTVGDTINNFTYDDVSPWPIEADGNGSYLQLIANNLDNTLPQNWRAEAVSSLGRTTAVDPQVFQDYGINITGVGYNIEGDDNLEFMFITNFGTEDRLVAGDSIFRGISFEFPAGTIIAAGETVMLSKDLTTYPDVTLRKFAWTEGRLSNGGEQISYMNAAGDIINDFTYDDVLPWPVDADGNGSYMKLIADDLDNRVASNWTAEDISTLGRTTAVDPQVFQDYGINITGVGYNIEGNDNLEFLYITNFGTEDRLVAGDSIFQGITFEFPAGTIIAAGETVMLSKDLSTYPEVTLRKFEWTDGKLSNGGEQIAYKNAAGDIINDFTYDDALPWPVDADGNGSYMQLIGDDLNNRVPTNWTAAIYPKTYECPLLSGNVGDSCDDGDATTGNDLINSDCGCVGTPINNSPLNITGINYNPLVDSTLIDDDFEFLLVTNFGADNISVAGDSILGVDFVFPQGEEIAAGETVMLVKNLAVYPDLGLRRILWNGSKLSNGGEQLVFKKEDNGVINDLTYDDVAPWPTSPDGDGYYLKLISPELDNTVAANWEAILLPAPVGFDCPALAANIGDACDDGDATTENDIVNVDCGCEGTPIVVFDCPALEANIGDACDDGDATTENDVVNVDCGCEGTPIVVFDCPALAANIGDACDDGDATTENDVVNAACGCEGTPIVVFDCPALAANIGDACDDGDATTENDIVNVDCGCEGTPIVVFDCPALEANIGDACDDGDATTENDIVNVDCGCEGTPIVVFDCPALAANIGDACDDGDATTENDVVTAACGCEGTPIDPCQASYTVSGLTITVQNLTAPITAVKVLNSDYSEFFVCNDWGTACNATEEIVVPAAGEYVIQIQTLENWSTPLCNIFERFTVTGIDPCIALGGDSDGDGICDDLDPCDNNLAGTACDDGDATTENDVYDNNCGCAGTPIAQLDCPALLANFGDACDDGDASTINDVIQTDCSCAGTVAPAGVDLELTASSAQAVPAVYTANSVTVTLTNAGGQPATGIQVHLPKPEGVVYTGGNEYTSSQGDLNIWGTLPGVWTVGDLAAGETATIVINYFSLSATGYAQYGEVLGLNEQDVDSNPSNGSGTSATEDDEIYLDLTFGNTLGLRIDLYPNPVPAGEQVVFKFKSSGDVEVPLLVSDLNGRVVFRTSVEFVDGINAVPVSIGNLPSGVYIVTLADTGLQPTRLIVR